MLSQTNILFWLNFLYFFLACFIAFYIPGYFFIRKLKIHLFDASLISIVFGMILWGLQGFVFGFLQVRNLTYLYLAFFCAAAILQALYIQKITVRKIFFKSIDWALFFILLVGSIVQILFVWFIGYVNNTNVIFCCFWPDAFYHTALTKQLINQFPPIEPGMNGTIVHNYHYFSNLIIAELIRVFHLPLLATQYQYSTVLLSFLLGLSVIVFTKQLKSNKSFNRWVLFFVYFSGDILFLLLLFLGKGLNFDLNISENATTLWFSPPRFYALVSLFTALSLITIWLRKKSLYNGILVGIIVGSLISLKVYTGIFALCGVIGISFYSLIAKEKYKSYVPLIISVAISLFLFIPINSGAGGLFFVGLWRFENFAVRPILNLSRLELARRIYLAHNNYIKVILTEVLFFLMYIYGLFGMFLLGFIQNKKSLSLFPKQIHIFLLSGLFVSLITGLFFYQTTGGANTLQFLFSVYIVGSIYLALACSYWLGKIPNRYIQISIIVLIIMLSGARVFRETGKLIYNLHQKNGFYMVDSNQFKAYAYINQHAGSNTPILFDEETSLNNICYVHAIFITSPIYLCGNGILEDHNVQTADRKSIEHLIFSTTFIPQMRESLKKSNIKYIVTVTQDAKNHLQGVFQNVYTNRSISVFKVSD